MYYIDSPSFSTATAVYTDELLTVKAPDGFYKFESGYREQLSGLLLNNIECTACIDCKQLVLVDVKTGQAFSIKFTDCWGYDHTLSFPSDPEYQQGHVRVIDLIDYNLCVKNASVYSPNTGYFYAEYGESTSCNISTGLVQSSLCSSGSETPTGCDIDCSLIESSFNVYIPNIVSNHLINGTIVYASNNIADPITGGDLYYKVTYKNIIYGVRISDTGVISELTYCNP